MKTRTLTVSSLTRDSKNRRGWTTVPFIRMIGRWLQDAGFEPGDTIQVEVDDGRLIITNLTPSGHPIEPANPDEFTFMTELRNTKTKRTRKDP